MKKLEIIIKAERLDEIKSILQTCGISGMFITNVMGYGNQKGFTAQYRGTTYTVNMLPKLLVETVTDDETASLIVKQITKEISTGEIGDGKIFIYDVVDAVRIRTGETGEDAL